MIPIHYLLYAQLFLLITFMVYLVITVIRHHLEDIESRKYQANFLLSSIADYEKHTGRSYIDDLSAEDRETLSDIKAWASK